MKTHQEIITNSELQKRLINAKSQNDLISISIDFNDIVIIGKYSNNGQKLLKTSAANTMERAKFWAKKSNSHFYMNGIVL